jgi:DNA invertase Pin-like site-specific DNA recombinase
MKAVIYVRVSTAEQVENFSLETQRRACADYCKREGIEIDTVFAEEGESAKTADRPELKRLLNHCQKRRKEIGYVVVYDVSRFSRNTLDHMLLRATLKKLGISLRAATQQFDDSSTGELVEFLLSGLAHFDNRQRADRTVAGMRAAVEKGRWVHQPPLGYVKPPDAKNAPSLAPDPERADLVRRGFEQVATGRSRREVLAELTALGLRTRRGDPLSLQTFGTLLRCGPKCSSGCRLCSKAGVPHGSAATGTTRTSRCAASCAAGRAGARSPGAGRRGAAAATPTTAARTATAGR